MVLQVRGAVAPLLTGLLICAHGRTAARCRGRPPKAWRRRMSDVRRGPLLALLAAALFGVSAPLAKMLLAHASPQLLAGLLYLGSGTGLAGLWLIRGSSNSEAQLTRKDAPWLAGAIAC